MDLSDCLTRPRRRLYASIRLKFGFALAVAAAWTMLSVWLATPWMDELGALTHPLFALAAITFIAFIPGFMNAFLMATLLMDRRPQRVPQPFHPGVTVLVAAYNEEAAIADTLTSVLTTDYPGAVEVLVLNDGSSDRTSKVAYAALERLAIPSQTVVRIVDFAVNRGKAAVLNAAFRELRGEVVVLSDANTMTDPGAIGKLARWFRMQSRRRKAVRSRPSLTGGSKSDESLATATSTTVP